MSAMQTQICNFGRKAVNFKLPSVDGKTHSLADVRGEAGRLVLLTPTTAPTPSRS